MAKKTSEREQHADVMASLTLKSRQTGPVVVDTPSTASSGVATLSL